MVKGRRLLSWAGILLLSGAASLYGIRAQGEKEPVPPAETGRPDLIRINALAAYQKLELPPAIFSHDKHTKALNKEKKDCTTCHKLSFAYWFGVAGRKKNTPASALRGIYHANCIGCHAEEAAAGRKTGPLDGECRSCHNAQPQITAVRLDAGFNLVSHYRHIDSKAIPAYQNYKDNCGRCHHQYNPKTKKTFYAQGKEESCRDCHLAKVEKDVESLEQASHRQCVLCHLDLAKKGSKDNLPTDCAGCHGAKAQALDAKKNQDWVATLPDKEVPRLKRGQPDAVLITHDPQWGEGRAGKPFVMDPVAFDHKAHEKFNDTCRVCHHSSMDACEKCHTLMGAKDGKLISFEKAMHSLSSRASCLGCHNGQQVAAECAGCHNHLSKSCRLGDASCQQCHLKAAETAIPGGATPSKICALEPAQKTALAQTLLQARNLNPGTYPLEGLPETVEIKTLANRFQPSEFSHKKHLEALLKGIKGDPLKGIKGNTLAEYFHSDPGTICQGCHHHSPPSQEPPRCSNCHSGESLQARESNRPALLAALHRQCLNCHTDMHLKKPASTACSECHKEKQK
ncbi:MAG: sulfate respiration complex hexadecaheme cytochrome HmcA [Desulfobaccales bacterium]